MSATGVPIIDLSPFEGPDAEESRNVELAVKEACENIGFLVVTGHGVPDDVILRMRQVSTAFFDLPERLKRQSVSEPGQTMGWVPSQKESLAATREEDTPPDLKESFDIRRPDAPEDEYYNSGMGQYFFRPMVWPKDPDEFRETWTEYYHEMERLAQRVMRLFAGALNLPHDFFADKLDRSVDYLRCVNYPAQDEEPLPGQLRAGAHTDYGTLTLLMTDDAPGGLQVQAPTGEWVDAPNVPNAYVINIGDMMSKWTDGRWVSTVHRVVNPNDSVRGSSRRLSIPFFQNPNYDALIAPISPHDGTNQKPQEVFMAGEWLMAKQNKSRVK
ncbi:isopenicillin N synthase family dioxygenase [Janibacter cremeus]|uniref:Isopenicillin N synthase-like dioxygenase n=1 Tax=Janibacter cremeus TaxID=1285192 RepID=A0A852VV43_9MICO|nr:isopenicillin N synthase family oxygenase [Janibacter cremeus]NYF97431.1 isopenicillin N synthase-like dioxygenase [Janibacter cremeus]